MQGLHLFFFDRRYYCSYKVSGLDLPPPYGLSAPPTYWTRFSGQPGGPGIVDKFQRYIGYPPIVDDQEPDIHRFFGVLLSEAAFVIESV